MEEHYIYAILGSAWLSFEDEWENGMVAYCTFQQMSRCVYNIGNVRSCVFEKCREAIKECTSEISESRFEECEKAIVDVCAKAVVSIASLYTVRRKTSYNERQLAGDDSGL